MATDNPVEPVALPGPANRAEVATGAALETLSNRELVTQAIDDVKLLAKKELELAKTELRANAKREIDAIKGFGIAALCAIWGVSLVLVAAALALGHLLPEWSAALIVGGLVFAAAAVAAWLGWKRHVGQPLETTRRTLREDASWMKERLRERTV